MVPPLLFFPSFFLSSFFPSLSLLRFPPPLRLSSRISSFLLFISCLFNLLSPTSSPAQLLNVSWIHSTTPLSLSSLLKARGLPCRGAFPLSALWSSRCFSFCLGLSLLLLLRRRHSRSHHGSSMPWRMHLPTPLSPACRCSLRSQTLPITCEPLGKGPGL